MKNLITSISLNLAFAACFGQNITFVDSELKNYLINENCVDTSGNELGDRNLDFNNDGEIQYIEAFELKSLRVSTDLYLINSLEDLSLFDSLETLVIDQNPSTLLSVILESTSLKKIRINDCGITFVDLSKAPSLETIRLESLGLKYLNIKNGSLINDFFSLFYTTIDSIICIDEIPEEYEQVFEWVNDSSKITTTCSTVGISETQKGWFIIYPNPSNTELHIETDDNIQLLSYQIIKLTGQQVKKGNFTSQLIDISELSSGQYIIELNTDKGNLSRSFLKK